MSETSEHLTTKQYKLTPTTYLVERLVEQESLMRGNNGMRSFCETMMNETSFWSL